MEKSQKPLLAPLLLVIFPLYWFVAVLRLVPRYASLTRSCTGLWRPSAASVAACNEGKKSCKKAPVDTVKTVIGEQEEDARVSVREVEAILQRLGLTESSEQEAAGHEQAEKNDRCVMEKAELSNLFDEEPGLDEVKEAFEVFDEDRDGFMTAQDLQRVLRRLGYEGERTRIEACRRMMEAQVGSGDGDCRMDLKSFVRFLEAGFCRS